ncbi:hypothetical protein AB0A63_01305 [Lentzea sp. NPDC042327]|uniref:hypothetical protein n=1 Tax=Lentzea sp. NPDC042327 TaxID=3154801 RepID=UPI0033D7E902
MENVVESIATELLIDGLTDWVHADLPIGWARETVGEDFKPIAVAVVEYVVLGGLMVAGDLGGTGFEAWPGTPADHVRTVVERYEAYDWNPQGMAGWLANTEAGDARVG